MEQDLVNIAEGRQSKDAVTARYINEYRELYDELSHKTSVLATTCKKYFADT